MARTPFVPETLGPDGRVTADPANALIVRHAMEPAQGIDDEFPIRDPKDPSKVHPSYAGADGKCHPDVRVEKVEIGSGMRMNIQVLNREGKLGPKMKQQELQAAYNALLDDVGREMARLIANRSQQPPRCEVALLTDDDVEEYEKKEDIGPYGLFALPPPSGQPPPTLRNGRILGIYSGALIETAEEERAQMELHPDLNRYALDADSYRPVTISALGRANSMAFANTSLVPHVEEPAYDFEKINAAFVTFDVSLRNNEGGRDTETIAALVGLENLFADMSRRPQVRLDYGPSYLVQFADRTRAAAAGVAVKLEPMAPASPRPGAGPQPGRAAAPAFNPHSVPSFTAFYTAVVDIRQGHPVPEEFASWLGNDGRFLNERVRQALFHEWKGAESFDLLVGLMNAAPAAPPAGPAQEQAGPSAGAGPSARPRRSGYRMPDDAIPPAPSSPGNSSATGSSAQEASPSSSEMADSSPERVPAPTWNRFDSSLKDRLGHRGFFLLKALDQRLRSARFKSVLKIARQDSKQLQLLALQFPPASDSDLPRLLSAVQSVIDISAPGPQRRHWYGGDTSLTGAQLDALKAFESRLRGRGEATVVFESAKDDPGHLWKLVSEEQPAMDDAERNVLRESIGNLVRLLGREPMPLDTGPMLHVSDGYIRALKALDKRLAGLGLPSPVDLATTPKKLLALARKHGFLRPDDRNTPAGILKLSEAAHSLRVAADVARGPAAVMPAVPRALQPQPLASRDFPVQVRHQEPLNSLQRQLKQREDKPDVNDLAKNNPQRLRELAKIHCQRRGKVSRTMTTAIAVLIKSFNTKDLDPALLIGMSDSYQKRLIALNKRLQDNNRPPLEEMARNDRPALKSFIESSFENEKTKTNVTNAVNALVRNLDPAADTPSSEEEV